MRDEFFNRKITVAIDMDDVMIDLIGAWTCWLNGKYGTNVKPEDVTNWDICRFFPSLSVKQVFEPIRTDKFWRTVKPVDGAIATIRRLIDDGFNVVVCTASHYKSIAPKYEYVIKKYFPFIGYDDIVVTHKKQLIRCDIMIDDNPDNLLGDNLCEKFVMSCPHNQSCDAQKSGFIRVDSWADIYQRVHQHADLLYMFTSGKYNYLQCWKEGNHDKNH